MATIMNSIFELAEDHIAQEARHLRLYRSAGSSIFSFDRGDEVGLVSDQGIVFNHS